MVRCSWTASWPSYSLAPRLHLAISRGWRGNRLRLGAKTQKSGLMLSPATHARHGQLSRAWFGQAAGVSAGGGNATAARGKESPGHLVPARLLRPPSSRRSATGPWPKRLRAVVVPGRSLVVRSARRRALRGDARLRRWLTDSWSRGWRSAPFVARMRCCVRVVAPSSCRDSGVGGWQRARFDPAAEYELAVGSGPADGRVSG